MSKYDPKDYSANPGKYRLFKTAVIAKHVFTENGTDDLREGQHVAIAFRCEVYNAMYRRKEPVFTLVEMDRDLFANALKDFVL